MRARLSRWLAVSGLAIVSASLIAQLWLTTNAMQAQGASLAEGVWRYFAYFTILTNCLVALVLARAVLRPGDARGLNAPRIELMTATSILFVGLIYNVVLASLWDPQGLQKAADVGLHNISPLVFAAYWLARAGGVLRWADAAFAATWPAAYAAYGLSRGAFDGFYPYFFMNPATTPWAQVALNMAGLVAVFGVAALLLVALDRSVLARSSKI